MHWPHVVAITGMFLDREKQIGFFDESGLESTVKRSQSGTAERGDQSAVQSVTSLERRLADHADDVKFSILCQHVRCGCSKYARAGEEIRTASEGQDLLWPLRQQPPGQGRDCSS